MKKNLFFVAVVGAMVLTGCTQSETIITENDYGRIINFDAFAHRVTKSVTEITSSNLQDQEFNILCYKGTSSYFQADETLEYSSSKWHTTVQDPYYWPTEGTLYFYISNADFSTASSTSQKITLSGFEYGNTNTDIVVASASGDCATGATVSLNAKHILSQLRFTIKGETNNLTYHVTELKISNIIKAGSYDLSAATALSLSTSSSDAVDFSDDDLDGCNGTTVASGDYSLIIPQTVASAQISVTYSVTDDNDEELYSGTQTADVTNLTFAEAKRYTIALTLPDGLREIEFTVTHTNCWDDADAIEEDFE